jgi:amino acid transporter
LLAAIPSAESSSDFDPRLVRFIAVCILSAICLLHYFSSQLGLFLNKLLALYKALLLFSIFIAGMIASGKEGSGAHDWTTKYPPGHGNRGISSLAALVLVLYSYTGWENANYVSTLIVSTRSG